MRWSSIAAIYTLFWAMSFFLVLPFRLRSEGEDRAIPGQAPSADARRAGRARRHPGTQRVVGSGRGVAHGRRAGGTLAGK